VFGQNTGRPFTVLSQPSSWKLRATIASASGGSRRRVSDVDDEALAQGGERGLGPVEAGAVIGIEQAAHLAGIGAEPDGERRLAELDVARRPVGGEPGGGLRRQDGARLAALAT
jgi:hypothetical protein